MSRQRWLLSLSLLLLASHAHGQVYRCEIDDSIVFSDQPCSEDSQEYQVISRISVIEPAADLDQVAERNQAFLRDRRERQAALRQARVERTREATVPPQSQTTEVTRVLYVPEPRHRLPPGSDRGRHGRQRDRTPEPREERPFSALSGPFPGTRRSDRDQRPRENPRDQ